MVFAIVATVIHPKYTLNGSRTNTRSRPVSSAPRIVRVIRMSSTSIVANSTVDSPMKS